MNPKNKKLLDLTESDVRGLFPFQDYYRGYDYYLQGKVGKLHYHPKKEGNLTITCRVRGTSVYDVEASDDGGEIAYGCTCPRFYDTSACKHVVAALLTLAEENNARLREEAGKKRILSYYLGMSQTEAFQDPSLLRLVPRIRMYRTLPDGYPTFAFRIGYQKLYSIRNIRNFLENVKTGETVSYGKNLIVSHPLSKFDEQSQQLIRLLIDHYGDDLAGELLKLCRSSSWYTLPEHDKNDEITFTGRTFDRFFDLFCCDLIETDKKGSISFSQKDPQVKVILAAKDPDVQVDVKTEMPASFFGGGLQTLYAWSGDAIVRCSEPFKQKLYPLLSEPSGQMRFLPADMAVFCSCILPEIEDAAVIEDRKNLLQGYLPDLCTPCFYFDMEDDLLVLTIAFRYGGEEISWKESLDQTPHIKRNAAIEQNALALARRFFTETEAGFHFSGGDSIAFLLDGLASFQKGGEVYLSDRLKRRQIHPKPTSIGVSLSNGSLLLDLDTNEFPAEELEALYQSLLAKKKYHLLKNGKFLALEGTSYEKLAEMSHILQLSPKDFSGGSISMPAYRGLYLDTLLTEQSGISIKRNQAFRAMVRNFKTVEDSDYSLPPGLEGVLRPYQKTGFRWLKTLESCGFGGILADEMGLGKSIQVIAFLSSLEGNQRPSLIVCPASLILNWGEEFSKFAPSLSASLIYGDAATRKMRRDKTKDADVFVTSYELLRQDISDFQNIAFYCCILDEGQHVKNQGTLGSKAVKRVRCSQRFVLTGTPIENRLSELWNLFDFLMPGYLFSHSTFVNKLEKPIIKSKNADAIIQLQRLVNPFMLRRLKKDVLTELPDKIIQTRPVSFSEEERKVYAATVRALRGSLSFGTGKVKIFAALTRLRQICCDPHLCFENYDGPASKLEACLELVSGMVENGHQVLLFSQFTSMLERIRVRLEQSGIESFVLQGSTSKEQRAQLVREFNDGKVPVFLISLKAGGTGLNLTAADIVIHYDPWWNEAAQNQATDRAHRMGQRKVVQVYKLIASKTIEEKILLLQEEKRSLMDTLFSASETSILDMSKEDLLSLLEE